MTPTQQEMDMTKSVRKDCLDFSRMNGLETKGDKQGIVTVFNPKNNWVDCFDNWTQCHAFLLAEVQKVRDGGRGYKWAS